jgi:hypothetical protein
MSDRRFGLGVPACGNKHRIQRVSLAIPKRAKEPDMFNIFEPIRLRDGRIAMVLKFDRPIPIIDEALGAKSLLVSPTKAETE